MDTKQAKKVINKNIKAAQNKGAAVKKEALKKYAVVKSSAIEKGDELEKIAMREYENIKKHMDATASKAEGYIKKNPAKAALISAGIGAALAAAASLLLSNSSSKKPAKRKK